MTEQSDRLLSLAYWSDILKKLKVLYTVKSMQSGKCSRAYCCVYFKNPASLRLMATFPISGNWMSGIARIMLVYQLILKTVRRFVQIKP